MEIFVRKILLTHTFTCRGLVTKLSIYCYLASRGDIFSIRAAGNAEHFVAMAIQLLGLWPKSVLKKMLLYRGFWQCVCER